jgi:hypothetical protein
LYFQKMLYNHHDPYKKLKVIMVESRNIFS